MPNAAAWMERFVKIPEVVKRWGHIKFAAKTVKPATVQAEKKVEEKPKAEAKKEGGDDDEEKPKKKEVNPLDILPPTTFDLYAFKTYFVNHADRRGEGMKFFFDNYDRAGYSIYFVHYEKAEGEGKVGYVFLNFLNGFLQRIDNFRKHTFSMTVIAGEEPNLEIMGVWLFRGKGIPQEMIDHPQFEYFKKQELNVDSEIDRQLITDFWAAKEGEVVKGLKITDAKLHK